MRRHERPRCHRHAAVIMGAAVEHVRGAQVGDPYEREISRSLHVISVGSSLGNAVEEKAINLIGAASGHYRGRKDDLRRNLPLELPIFVCDSRSVELDVGGDVIGEQNLARGQQQHVADVGPFDRCIGRSRT